MTKRVYNFSPGPAVLPLPVLEQIQSEMLSLPGVGASVLEISHRSPAFDAILAESQTLIRQLLGVPENYRILFMQGGAHLQFTAMALNFLRGTGKTAEYIITGTWGNAALKEAQKEGPDARRLGRQGAQLFAPAGVQRTEIQPRRRVCPHDVERDDPGRAIRRPARHRLGAADLRFVVRLSCPARSTWPGMA